ncbi:hypothetical protein ACFQ3L_10660 [Lacticaseibacillus jixianensis]|uniref:Uncharacterized protein n=1 Tax=Lacticaseibacillus jixianensis TaxID=2486012 RepID=A0ABW4BAQ2_9LACO|nr:hypothetical protein [Lacticaseibacillus jixianensis]
MAEDKVKKATKIVVDIPDEDAKIAEKAMNDQGFVTPKELPRLTDIDYSRSLAAVLTKAREGKSEEGYIYSEEFDFAGGEIENIIWNMDQIKNRDAAKRTLADHMGLTMPTETLSKADKETF